MALFGMCLEQFAHFLVNFNFLWINHHNFAGKLLWQHKRSRGLRIHGRGFEGKFVLYR
jgi:hypothetical protein